MSESGDHAAAASGQGHHGDDHGGHGHHEQGFVSKYIFSVDHKVIGVQYGVSGLIFLLIGFCLMLMMRWQIAHPGIPIGDSAAVSWMPGFLKGFIAAAFGSYLTEGAMSGDVYNQFGAMHGTIMVFLGVVPLAVGAFGNYVVPLQIGAPDMAFPRLNMLSYWLFLPGGLLAFVSFFLPGGAAQSGWTSYTPLSVTAPTGQTLWLVAMIIIITSSLLGSVNFIVTMLQLRAPGLTFSRLPFFVWVQLVTAFLLLLAFPPLEAACVLQLMDRVAETSFFMPSGLIVNNVPLEISGGGSPLLWQHLFWFLAHPEVYVLVLPAMGIVAEIIANNTRKPLWGFKSLVYSSIFLGFMSFVVWAHHMFLTGMGTTISTFFQTTTMIISIPSVIILTALFISLWGASIRFTTPMLFALAFLPMFGIGGLTGLPLGLSTPDIFLHDTYYVIGHFHYVVAPGTIFALFAGIYYWYPKITGRRMIEWLGKLHFIGSFVFMNGIFMPMFVQGMAGMSRRMSDGGGAYIHNAGVLGLNNMIFVSAVGLAIFQIPFVINFFYCIVAGAKVGDNHWDATTLDWAAAPSPPVGHGNFHSVPTVYRGPCEYSVPGASRDFSPQNEPIAESERETATQHA